MNENSLAFSHHLPQIYNQLDRGARSIISNQDTRFSARALVLALVPPRVSAEIGLDILEHPHGATESVSEFITPNHFNCLGVAGIAWLRCNDLINPYAPDASFPPTAPIDFFTQLHSRLPKINLIPKLRLQTPYWKSVRENQITPGTLIQRIATVNTEPTITPETTAAIYLTLARSRKQILTPKSETPMSFDQMLKEISTNLRSFSAY